jgi:hypothetical protein
MPDLQPIPFGGLAALDNDNLLTLDQALLADDCYLDDSAISGRNGYRSALAGQITTPGNQQHIGRFRPSATSARVIDVINGSVFADEDPSSETVSDGIVHNIGTPFANTDLISGAGLGTNYYLGSNNPAKAMQRVNSGYTLDSLQAIPQGALPTYSLGGQIAWTPLSTIAPALSGMVRQTNANTGMGNMNSAWRAFTKTNNGNDDPLQGATAQFKLPSPVNANGFDWLAMAVSPHDSGGTVTSYAVQIACALDVAGSPGVWQILGQIYDVPPVGGSPNVVFLDLRPLDPATRAAIQWLQFQLTGTNGGKWILYGYAFLPGKPVDPPPFNYYVDFFDGAYTANNLTAPTTIASGQQSKLAGPVAVTPGTANIASYPDSYMTSNEPYQDNINDSILGANTNREFNQQSGAAAFPLLEEIGAVVTISGVAPTFTMASLTARLWEDTDNGRRLVAVATVTSGAAYNLVDNGGVGKLANQVYVAGGVGPPCNALGAYAGRLIAGMGQRVFWSSFIPTSNTSNPFPQWPDIPLTDSDGYSYDIGPSSEQQIQVINGEGDGAYIVTQDQCWVQTDPTPGALPVFIYDRGALGRHAGCFAEERFFWAAYDGVYQAVNTSNVSEMTMAIRRLYTSWLQPDSNVVVSYQNRKLYVFEGQRFLRYDFVQQKWTRGTIADTVNCAASWVDPGGTNQMWLLTATAFNGRWQTSAVRDMQIGVDITTGQPIPDWQFSTGFDLTPENAVVDGWLLDATGRVELTLAKTVAGTVPTQARLFVLDPPEDADEGWYPGSAQFKAMKFRVQMNAANPVTVRRCMWERTLIPSKGG